VDSPDRTSASDIRTFLARVRGRLRRHDGARAALYAIGGLVALGLILPLASLLAIGSRTTAVTILAIAFLVALALVIGGVLLGAILPYRRWRPDSAVARYVGRREPPLASDLLSAVELGPQLETPAARGAPSPALVGALVDATAKKIGGLEPRALVPDRQVRYAMFACFGALAVHTAVLAAAPHAMVRGWRKLLVKPRSPFAGAALTPTPLVGDLRVTLDFPAYTRRPKAVLPSSSGEFRALPGTRVVLETRALEPVTSATVLIERDGVPGEPEIVTLTVDGDQLRGELLVDGAMRYRFEVERPDRRRLVETTPRAIELEPDLAPQVQLLTPGDDLDVTSMKRIELGITAEDDHGLTELELVWTSGGETVRKPLSLVTKTDDGGDPARVQAKLVWDLAEVTLPPGARVDYHVEATDNDDVRGPNIGSSRVFHLRVFSPRERHEANLARQQELAEKLIAVLGGRLPHAAQSADDLELRDELHRVTAEAVVELGTLVAAYDKDPQADPHLKKDLEAMRGRLDKLTTAEARIDAKIKRAATGPTKGAGAKFTASDKAMATELEDDVIALADWLDRERLETLLDVADEIAAHRKRLDELMEEFAKTGDPRVQAEIERELRALEQSLAELAQKRAGMTADVLDQFVNPSAMQDRAAGGCVEEVRALMDAGKVAEAQARLARCGQELDSAQNAMESALEDLRGDRFSDEQQKLNELMGELADVAQDQAEIAAEADKIFERYADEADELMEDLGKDAKRRLSSTLEKLRDRIHDIPTPGLTPFAQEELDIVDRRLDDLEHMLDDGDLAEALAMARQAKQSLDTVTAELEAALEDDPTSPWADETSEALDAVEHAHPPADKLIEELGELSPSPDQILDQDDKAALDRLRRRQKLNQDRADKLAQKANELGPELPGTAGEEIGGRVEDGAGKMGQAEQRMKQRDPSGARDAARSAADALQQAQQRARAAARQQLSDGGAGLDSEPIRIPGADEYKAPEHFREDILEAMKKQAPSGYDDMIQRYYEELIR